MIQIRSVPEELHRRLKARAALEGLSMSEFVLREVRKALDRPSRQEMIDRLRSKPVRRLRPAAADIVRVERDAR
jgi:antitoxin FitA